MGSNSGIKQPPRLSVQLKKLPFTTGTMYLCFGEVHTYMILNPSVTEFTQQFHPVLGMWGCCWDHAPNPFEIL